jgi:Helicase conserved C-terminal domain/SNF2-related domain
MKKEADTVAPHGHTGHPAMIDLINIEFHRTGYGMLPDSRDKDPGAPVCFPRTAGGQVFTGYCNCRASRTADACQNFSRLVQLASEIKKRHRGLHWGESYVESLWYRLAQLLSEADPLLCADVRVTQATQDRTLAFLSTRGTLLARLSDGSAASLRFVERAGKLPQPSRFQDRAALIERIIRCLQSDEEKKINEAGVLTLRQAAEQSFWGRLAYHCFREYGNDYIYHPAIEESSGDFILECVSPNSEPLLKLAVPRRQVRKALALLSAEFPKQSDLAIHPVPLRSIFLVSEKTELDLEVRPVIQALQSSGEAKFFAGKEFAKFRYGDLVYLREMNILAELEKPGSGRKFTAPVSMRLEKSRLPAFLDEHRREIAEGLLVLDDPLRHLSVLREYDRVEIVPGALERSWHWLSIRYGFGSDSVSLADIYMEKGPEEAERPATAEFSRLIAPFVMRRLKSAVLDELPEKFEDFRTCALSEMQVRLYREAISTKGVELVEQIRAGARRLPYIHVFALLNLLKRICDHPALALNKIEQYQDYQSGKWELFQELLFESLDSGHKVVVFSQYLGMITMIERLLSTLGVEFATLTGASVHRGEIVRRFNDDPACRVFLGSLKAGGAGIDLVGGSVVIHYDRWWNAAREDQATDRVHRIGQRSAVQVFKLITEGTLEEKISAIVARKRHLMDSVVQTDDPHLNKIFTRQELLELLRPV